VTQTRITPEGIALFVACHPNVVRINHEESFQGLAFVRRQAQVSCNSMFATIAVELFKFD